MLDNPKRFRPFLRWAGSKRQILPHLAKYWASGIHKRYVEPFAGSACLFFYIHPPKAILNDINSDLIATYLEVKNNLPLVIKYLSLFEMGKDEYYLVRSMDVSNMSPQQRAARFIYLNRFCFNGLYRTNKKGEFNVPYGGFKTGNIPESSDLDDCSKALKRTQLLTGDFAVALECVKTGDFVYLDPPYHMEGHRIFKEYGASSFNENDLIRIRYWMDTLNRMGISFVLTYLLSEETNYLTTGYQSETVTVIRNIAGFVKNRRKVEELIISNIDLSKH